MANNSKVVFERVFFPVKVAVFEHQGEEGRVNYTAKVTKSFRRGEDAEWENSDYLGTDDLLPGAKLMEAAHAYIMSKQQASYQRKREDRQAVAAGQDF